MREKKFRGKRISDGELVIGDLVTETDGNMEIKRTFIHLRLSPVDFTEDGMTSKLVLHEVDPKTLGQYTGLKDKNGKEIYEGDILSGLKQDVYVKWDEKWACWIVSTKTEHGLGSCPYEEMEVIGNIYENADLLGLARSAPETTEQPSDSGSRRID